MCFCCVVFKNLISTHHFLSILFYQPSNVSGAAFSSVLTPNLFNFLSLSQSVLTEIPYLPAPIIPDSVIYSLNVIFINWFGLGDFVCLF